MRMGDIASDAQPQPRTTGVVVALPLLNMRLIDPMLDMPHVARLFDPLPGKLAIAEEPLRDILLRTSEMASELPWLSSFKISSL